MNVLVTSIAKKVPLLRDVRNALGRVAEGGKLFGADIDCNCVGRHFCDSFWLMPDFADLTLSELLDFCETHKISAIIPTRDGELLRFAEWVGELEKASISVMVAEPDAITVCLDKLKFFQNLEKVFGLNLCPASDDIDSLGNGVSMFVVKERFGSASKKIAINVTRQQAIEQAEKLENPVFQPFIEGQEYSIDLYRSRQGINIGVVARSRDLIVAGESQISTTVENGEIEKMCLRAADTLNLKGHAVFQGIVDEDGDFHIIECNPRFGGASTLGIAAGLDSFYLFLSECRGRQVTEKQFINKTPMRLVRYPKDLIVEASPGSALGKDVG